ncbi:MAG TPA: hypothetical protein VJZ26_10450 [Blastocatellia bacterium]|nr:hypothetical protein [Blastocatellia bacterium]
MIFEALNPNATVTIALQGLSVCCFNESFDNGRGRWEVAIPRFEDHTLTIQMEGFGTLLVGKEVKFIEFKDRLGIASKPTHEIGTTFDRKARDKHDKNDFRWITEFTNTDELPHKNVSVITKADNPDRVDVTMLYLYDATLYTKVIEPALLIRSEIKSTVPVDAGALRSFRPQSVGAVLDQLDEFGFETKAVGMDIQSPRGGSVDIIFDNAITATVPQGGGPKEIIIQNLDTPPKDEAAAIEEAARRTVLTEESVFGLGDFFRYYELFQADDDPRFHIWEKHARTADVQRGRTSDCNSVRVSLANLNAML